MGHGSFNDDGTTGGEWPKVSIFSKGRVTGNEGGGAADGIRAFPGSVGHPAAFAFDRHNRLIFFAWHARPGLIAALGRPRLHLRAPSR